MSDERGDGPVGLVIVSHSAKLADGVVEVAAQMAPDVAVVAAGGLADGGVGTDYDGVVAAVQRADSGAGVVLLYDLGSAQLTAELAVESLPDPDSAVVVDAPLVEGAVAAAVEAQGGGDRTAVASAAAAAGGQAGGETTSPQPSETAEPSAQAQRLELTLANEVGLHARPAATLARGVADLDAEVTIRKLPADDADRADTEESAATADARSVLALLSLSARQGDRIEVVATGAQAGDALAHVQALVERNFDE